MTKLSYIKILFSPFKPFKLDWYLGKIAIGVPIFYPRKKIGFNVIGLAWKTKWDSTDYRFEWSPVFSFVFFKWQIAIRILVENPDEYWTAWLYYENNTDHTLSKQERLELCRENFPLTHTVYNAGKMIDLNYYDLILKNKYNK